MEMSDLRTLLTRKRLLFILIAVALWSAAVLILDPSARVGPLGVGLPATWTRLEVAAAALCVSHPDSWVGFETPQGSHGDRSVVASIGVPGRSLPQIKILAGDPNVASLSDLVVWAEERARQRTGYSSLDPQLLPPSGWDGQVSEYVFSASGLFRATQIRCYDFSFITASGGYALSMCAEADDWPVVEPVFREVIDTVSVTRPDGADCGE